MGLGRDAVTALEDWDDEQGERTYDTFRIDTDAEADWALRKLGVAEAEMARLRQRHADEVEVLNARLAETLKTPASSADLFRAHLIAYHQKVRPNGERHRLMNGDLTSRAGSRVVVVEDEELLLTWLESEGLDDCVRVKRAPSLSALKVLMDKQDVTVLPGARIEVKDRSWLPVVERPV